MKQITIISGKGGTGKTTVTANFAALAQNAVIADCDVDAANLYLLLNPVIKQKHPFTGGKAAQIDQALCTRCGLCASLCRFNAIHDTRIDTIACEGCGFCSYACPEQAIQMIEQTCGEYHISSTEYGPFVHARLAPGQDNSGKLVTQVRTTAKEIAQQQQAELILIDGPPGIGCPVIAAMTGVDAVVVITEPSASALHDLKRIVELSKHFKTESFAIINKWDINQDKAEEIEQFCQINGVRVLGRIPFDLSVIDSVNAAQPLIRYTDNTTTTTIKEIWTTFLTAIN